MKNKESKESEEREKIIFGLMLLGIMCLLKIISLIKWAIS